MHDVLPLRRNLCQINAGVADRAEDLGEVTAAGQEQGYEGGKSKKCVLISIPCQGAPVAIDSTRHD